MSRPLKVLFVFQGLAHYYNYVLNRLNRVPGLSVAAVVPPGAASVGEGVFVTRDDVNFTVHELPEYRSRFGDLFLRNFWRILWRERPDIVVATPPHLRDFVFHVPTFLSMKLLGARLILKSIPFRVPLYQDLRSARRQAVVRELQRPSAWIARAQEWSRKPSARWLKAAGSWACRMGMRLRERLAFARVGLDVAVQRFFWRLPDAHVNYVEAAREVYGSYGVPEEKIFVTYNSPDTDRLFAAREMLRSGPHPPDVSPHRLIHVGRLVAWKRVDLFLRAVAGVKERVPDVDALVVGDGPGRTALERLASDLGIAGDVRFVGEVYDPVELGRLLMSSAVYVLAGMGGISLNEAMAFGRPVICSVCDGTEKHLVRDGYNGLLFREGDVDDLCAKIERLLADPSLTKRMGQNAAAVIRDEINVHTVIRGYLRAFAYVTGREIGDQGCGAASERMGR
jgi:glycosyltransferase involved in cell wall biosynthesis